MDCFVIFCYYRSTLVTIEVFWFLYIYLDIPDAGVTRFCCDCHFLTSQHNIVIMNL